jgi:ABC-type protease/lipase transport system fused ATPase/permease subunit
MLQVYDRVLVSQNELTLITLSLAIVFMFVVMAVSEWLRTRNLLEDAEELFGPVDNWTPTQMDEMRDTATWTQRLADLRSHG